MSLWCGPPACPWYALILSLLLKPLLAPRQCRHSDRGTFVDLLFNYDKTICQHRRVVSPRGFQVPSWFQNAWAFQWDRPWKDVCWLVNEPTRQQERWVCFSAQFRPRIPCWAAKQCKNAIFHPSLNEDRGTILVYLACTTDSNSTPKL